jgi:hypothetical protein
MVAPKKEGNNTVDDSGKPLWRMAPESQRALLAGWHEVGLPRHGIVDVVQEYSLAIRN